MGRLVPNFVCKSHRANRNLRDRNAPNETIRLFGLFLIFSSSFSTADYRSAHCPQVVAISVEPFETFLCSRNQIVCKDLMSTMYLAELFFDFLSSVVAT